MVIAQINKIFFLSDPLFILLLPFNTLSKNLSDKSTNKPPIIKPKAGNSHTMYPKDSDKSRAGAINSQKKYDLIIIDDELKLNNALEILKELKRNKKFNVPVIVMLEKNKEYFKDDYIESGFSDYILKNNITEELKRIFEKEN